MIGPPLPIKPVLARFGGPVTLGFCQKRLQAPGPLGRGRQVDFRTPAGRHSYAMCADGFQGPQRPSFVRDFRPGNDRHSYVISGVAYPVIRTRFRNKPFLAASRAVMSTSDFHHTQNVRGASIHSPTPSRAATISAYFSCTGATHPRTCVRCSWRSWRYICIFHGNARSMSAMRWSHSAMSRTFIERPRLHTMVAPSSVTRFAAPRPVVSDTCPSPPAYRLSARRMACTASSTVAGPRRKRECNPAMDCAFMAASRRDAYSSRISGAYNKRSLTKRFSNSICASSKGTTSQWISGHPVPVIRTRFQPVRWPSFVRDLNASTMLCAAS